MSTPKFKREDYSANAECVLDQLRRPEAVPAKAKIAFKNGNFDYYFEAMPEDERPAALEANAARFSDEDFWHYVRRFWVKGYQPPTVLNLMASDRPRRELLMRKHEHSKFHKLGDRIVVYRGSEDCAPNVGWSWTSDIEVARKFAVQYRGEAIGTLLRGICAKANVIAYFDFDAMHEDEVVVNPEFVFSLEERSVTFADIEMENGEEPWKPWRGRNLDSA